MNYVEPTPNSVVDLLEIIFGEGVVATPIDEPFGDGDYTATYIDPEDKLVAMGASDPHFVAYSSAALSMVPAAVANEAVANGEITDVMAQNFYEVMNICSKLMLTDGGPHLRLADVVDPGKADAGSMGALESAAKRIGFSVDIPGYGVGKLQFLVT